jgi:hypothetical protein
MARFLCPDCREVVDGGPARFAFCPACGAPLTIENILPIQLIRPERNRADLATGAAPRGQASRGATVAPRAAPALAATTSRMAAISRATSASPSTR